MRETLSKAFDKSKPITEVTSFSLYDLYIYILYDILYDLHILIKSSYLLCFFLS